MNKLILWFVCATVLSACSLIFPKPVSQKLLAKTTGNLSSKASVKSIGKCDIPDFDKQVTVGYQGWFGAKGDGIANVWKHWSHYNKTPAKKQVTFELYPDVSEYRPQDLFPTKLANLGNGKPAKLFSSARKGVVDLHFKWLSDYGLDGVALQRFASELSNKKNLKHNNKVAQLVKQKAEKYCRTFYIMYDVSGSNPKDVVKKIKLDWDKNLDKQLQITQSKQYARYNNKPVIGLWGFGFDTPAHPFTQKQASKLINWFHNKGFYVVGGVPYNWRKGELDSKKHWMPVYQQYDLLLPWSVGRYRNIEELWHHYQSIWQQDAIYAKRHHLKVKRVIFPGFAWSNWNGRVRNQIPRNKGELLWKQAYYAHQLDLGVYIAMFDEYDEGTAIAKAAVNNKMIPRDQYFLTLSADGYKLSSDYYLRLADKITRMIQGKKYYSSSVPIN